MCAGLLDHQRQQRHPTPVLQMDRRILLSRRLTRPPHRSDEHPAEEGREVSGVGPVALAE
jgi:hypothetical protein